MSNQPEVSTTRLRLAVDTLRRPEIMTTSHARGFVLSEIPKASAERMEAVLRDAMEVRENDPDKHEELLKFYFKLGKEEAERQATEYPPDPPNSECSNAILTGFLCSNETGLSRGDCTPLFKLKHEKISLWTHASNTNSVLISQTDPAVHHEICWLTAGSKLRLAFSLRSALETIPDVDYDWIYRFDPTNGFEETKFLDRERFDRSSGFVHKVLDYAESAPMLELLDRDERFYVGAQNLLASFENHWFCVICALTPEHHRMHEVDELAPWHSADAISKMEAAIVQATRTVEGFLGKPGNREEPRKLQRMLDRWQEVVPIDPNSVYDRLNLSYLDYYYQMFGTRGDAAHSLGKLPLAMSRKLTIDAQCFACKILMEYFDHHKVKHEEARKRMGFNETLFASDDASYSSPITADDPGFSRSARAHSETRKTNKSEQSNC